MLKVVLVQVYQLGVALLHLLLLLLLLLEGIGLASPSDDVLILGLE
jgi:hypothetical protein